MSSPPPVSPRTRVVALVVVVALVAASAATLVAMLLSVGSGEPDRQGGPSQPSSAADGGGHGTDAGPTLVLPGAPPGRCAAFSVEVLRGAEQAFAGTALTVADREVVLRVDRWYRGGEAGLVRLTTGGAARPALDEGPGFAEGERYLVSADDGVVTPCGFSAAWSPAMARAYAEAFEG